MSIRRPLKLVFALVAASVVFTLSSGAGATENPDYVKPAEEVETSTPQPVRQTSAVVARQQLAITGSDATQMVVIGAVLISGGAATLVLRRRAAA